MPLSFYRSSLGFGKEASSSIFAAGLPVLLTLATSEQLSEKATFYLVFFVFVSNLWCNYYKNTANLYIFMSVSLGKSINLHTVKMSRPNVSSFG